MQFQANFYSRITKVCKEQLRKPFDGVLVTFLLQRRVQMVTTELQGMSHQLQVKEINSEKKEDVYLKVGQASFNAIPQK